mgnify:CR=1 FL=1
MARASTGARLHFGFCNLSLSHERLYGALGVGLREPRVVVDAESADGVCVETTDGVRVETTDGDGPAVDAADPAVDEVRAYARIAVDLLDVEGARVAVRESLSRHAGLGSGTQLAAATLAAVAADGFGEVRR